MIRHNFQHFNSDGCLIDNQFFDSWDEMDNYAEKNIKDLWIIGDYVVIDSGSRMYDYYVETGKDI